MIRGEATMPSTHLSLHYHAVFSAKERHPFINSEWQERLQAYLGRIVRDLGVLLNAWGESMTMFIS